MTSLEERFKELLEEYLEIVDSTDESCTDDLEFQLRLELKGIYSELLIEKNTCKQELTKITNLSDLQNIIKNINKNEKDIHAIRPFNMSKIFLNHFKDLTRNIESFDGDEKLTYEILSVIPLLKHHLDSYYDNRRKTTGFGGKVEENMKTREKNILLFRGHSNKSFELMPNLYRDKSHYINEDILYKETYMKCFNQFESSNSYLEILTIMQHYGLPTRLLDLTTNPLVALYFAVVDTDIANKDADAELVVFHMKNNQIKYYDSDSVNILCALATLDYGEKQVLFKESIKFLNKFFTNSIKDDGNPDSAKIRSQTPVLIEDFNKVPIVKKLNREIEKKNGMYLKEIHPITLISLFTVQPMPNNDRISRQQGLFFIPGLFTPSSTKRKLQELQVSNFTPNKILKLEDMLSFLNLTDISISDYPLLYSALISANYCYIPPKPKYIIPSKSKEELQKDLELFGINESTIYPDIVNVISMIKTKYKTIKTL